MADLSPQQVFRRWPWGSIFFNCVQRRYFCVEYSLFAIKCVFCNLLYIYFIDTGACVLLYMRKSLSNADSYACVLPKVIKWPHNSWKYARGLSGIYLCSMILHPHTTPTPLSALTFTPLPPRPPLPSLLRQNHHCCACFDGCSISHLYFGFSNFSAIIFYM